MSKQVTGLEIELAMAINGPWDFPNHLSLSRFSKDELRKAKWDMLTSAEQSNLINGVRALLHTLHDKPNFMLLFESYMRKLDE